MSNVLEYKFNNFGEMKHFLSKVINNPEEHQDVINKENAFAFPCGHFKTSPEYKVVYYQDKNNFGKVNSFNFPITDNLFLLEVLLEMVDSIKDTESNHRDLSSITFNFTTCNLKSLIKKYEGDTSKEDRLRIALGVSKEVKRLREEETKAYFERIRNAEEQRRNKGLLNM